MSRKNLIVSLILIIIGLSILLFVFFNNKSIEQNSISIYDITKSGGKSINVNAYLDASYIVTNIANYAKDEKNSFYVVFGHDVQFIVYMKNSEAVKVNKYLLDNPESTYRLVGITKEMPQSIKKMGKEFVKTYLDFNHEHEKEDNYHDHNITDDDFDTYFGYIYLDCVTKNNLLPYIGYILIVMGILSLSNFYIKKWRIHENN